MRDKTMMKYNLISKNDIYDFHLPVKIVLPRRIWVIISLLRLLLIIFYYLPFISLFSLQIFCKHYFVPWQLTLIIFSSFHLLFVNFYRMVYSSDPLNIFFPL
ncbi:hypothetical protein H311_00997 [Anncaliia algerae PRA109]|nr:hypothetical protein H311_00997 [Anncaliia algerae PRA109]